MTTRRTGLREQKKQATERALREAALRLALERGPDNVRVDDIAQAAGVSPRTYNNYFSSREQAIIAAITAQRQTRLAESVTGRPDGIRLAEAITDSIVEQYTGTGHDEITLITTSPALREAFLHATTAIEDPLATAIAHRLGDTDPATAAVLAAAITAAVRTALRRWLQPAPTAGGLVIPTGALPNLLRTALEVLAPALDAAEEHRRQRR
ncbi:TetR/AcrR family transcriptional regulator [Saccharopolyspora indica]|uniref:TetR/AcrR family transcriptional regulator n=1 Tax=Saccharopolyspora indica TaxID=1229659 RepID=UPI0022EB9984|nr:TetR/AcrR family transcriptional regulator [Saccharopolyspora indica]MDA3643119.1 helix-turn-helix domain containing protein [Saccharopolyspora indica]